MDKLGDGLIKEDGNYEVESQFILRLPPLPAASLKAVVHSGVLNLKDRLNIQIEQDMRHGTVRFDGWTMPAKIVDLPCVIESHKTLDKKNFYKTADICQMMICRNELDEEEDRNQEKLNKDGKDRRFIYPHGITPPLKNVRKKRFRKTLKKKVVDVPEIEKEVKRLFRTDNEAMHVRYEVVNADDGQAETVTEPKGEIGSPGAGVHNHNSQSLDLVEHDLFGEMLSSSDDEDEDSRLMQPNTSVLAGATGTSSGGVNSTLGRGNESDENSRMSMGLSKDAMDDSNFGTTNRSSTSAGRYITEFSKGMLLEQSGSGTTVAFSNRDDYNMPNLGLTSTSAPFDEQSLESNSAADAVASLEQQVSESGSAGGVFVSNNDSQLLARLNELETQLTSLRERRQAQELEIASIENLALQQRFQSVINDLRQQEAEKSKEYDEILIKLH